jgi:hypothetical protein
MKTRNYLRACLLTLIIIMSAISAWATEKNPVVPIEHRQEQMNRLEQRLEEIRAIDTKRLTKDEKRALRGEVKQIKKEMKALSGGVYISIGALILIVLLLILLA